MAAKPEPETQRAPGAKFINFRTDPATFKAIKMAALNADMTLGEYLTHAHETLQANLRTNKS